MKHVSRISEMREKRVNALRSLVWKRSPKARLQSARDEMLLGTIVGSATGERDRDPMGGGWEGTDDANSTAPSDLSDISKSPTGRIRDPDIQKEADDPGNLSEMEEIDFPAWPPEKLKRVF